MNNKKNIGLALSGGGARGLAHIGVLKVLKEAEIKVSFIGGSSMGGIIGALYAAGMSPEDLGSAAINKSKLSELIHLADITAIRRGLFEGHRIRALLSEWLHDIRTFDNLKIPLTLSAVDLNSSSEITLNRGELLPAIMATSAFPGIFPAIDHDGYRLIDGGVLNNLPVDRVREMGADIVIGVDVLFQVCDVSTGWKLPIPTPGFFEEFYRAEMIIQAQYARLKLEQCHPEVLICPQIPSNIAIFIGFTHAEQIITSGERAARQALPLIYNLIEKG